MIKPVIATALSLLLPFSASITYAQASKHQPAIVDYTTRNHPVIGREGMVSSQNFIATEIGAEILKQGGNAIDSAVAVGLALAVTLPRAGNIGGGGFMLVYIADENRTIALDFRETAPLLADKDMFFEIDQNGKKVKASREDYHFSYRSSAVPGTVAGFDWLLKNYGTMSWKQVAAPAIKLAKDGFIVSDDLASILRTKHKTLAKHPSTRKIFIKPDGSGYQAGDTLVQKDLAWSLEQLAKGGADAFYQGAIAKRIAADMQKNNGLISLADLAKYRVAVRKPISGTYGDATINAMPAPSSGGTHVVQMLNILENFDLEKMGQNSAAAYHLITEAMKLAYADRSKYLGDPDFVDIPTDILTSKAYAKDLAKSISLTNATAASEIAPGNLAPYESDETTHYSVMDKDGNAVANTYTLMFSFGSGVVIEGTGIIMNNNLGNFTLSPDIPDAFGLMGSADNLIRPGRRPVSSMTPTIVTKNGKPFLLTGSPGGSKIISTVMQQILNVLAFDMNLADATDAPRIHHQWSPDALNLEPGISPDTIKILEAMGHNTKTSKTMGSLQSIMYKDGLFFGYSDTRRPGAKTIGLN
ncbi:gamma-glutamyltransferase [Endozoicomonas sp. G2_1]|nr:gamma-glutamyltransferase [Endozoicomonas sp. G2_1]